MRNDEAEVPISGGFVTARRLGDGIHRERQEPGLVGDVVPLIAPYSGLSMSDLCAERLFRSGEMAKS